MSKVLAAFAALLASFNFYVATHKNVGGTVDQQIKTATVAATDEPTAKQAAKTSYAAGKYYTDASQPFTGITTLTAKLVMDDVDIDNASNTINKISLEQSLDNGKTWTEVSSMSGWQGGLVTSFLAPDGTQDEQVTVPVDKFDASKGTKVITEQVPKYKEITPETNPDDFRTDVDPGFVVQIPNDKQVRLFRVFFEIPQPIGINVLFSAQ